MEIIYKIFTMYGIAFCIAMFVAFVIWLANWLMSDSNVLFSFFRKKETSQKANN